MEKVHVVGGIHDGDPLDGVADYDGRPHAYQRIFDKEQDEWSDQYRLKEIDADLLALALESHEIFWRWRGAFDERKAGFDTFPALPADHERYRELKKIIGDRLLVPVEDSIKVLVDSISILYGPPAP